MNKKIVPTSHPLHKVWYRYVTGCTKKNNCYWDALGGKGLTIAEEWMDFNTFYNWAISEGWEEGYSFHLHPNIKEINSKNIYLFKQKRKKTKKLKVPKQNQSYSQQLLASLYDEKLPVKTLPEKIKNVPDELQRAIEFIMKNDYRETPFDAVRSSVLREASRLGF